MQAEEPSRDLSPFAVTHPAETGPSPRDAVGHCSAWGQLFSGTEGVSAPPSRVCCLGPTPELLAVGYRRPLLLPEPRK